MRNFQEILCEVFKGERIVYYVSNEQMAIGLHAPVHARRDLLSTHLVVERPHRRLRCGTCNVKWREIEMSIKIMQKKYLKMIM